MNTQRIVDNAGNIVFLQAGFLGSLNDAGNFNLMERIGAGAKDAARKTEFFAYVFSRKRRANQRKKIQGSVC